MIEYNDFLKVDIRVGTVIDAKPFPEARNPALKLWIDFGEDIGIKKTSAQITQNYTPETIIGLQVCAVVNFPSKQIGPFMSQCLTLGFEDANGNITLIKPEKLSPNGSRLH
ncbi:MAG: tRNA-binding protein [Alphaproteobacteria bacterium]|nr:MAG: tRNA-binding protein [Alphaproteobacteria bacterium]